VVVRHIGDAKLMERFPVTEAVRLEAQVTEDQETQLYEDCTGFSQTHVLSPGSHVGAAERKEGV
jgi:hypothetical protein